jgi:hypothetical protein
MLVGFGVLQLERLWLSQGDHRNPRVHVAKYLGERRRVDPLGKLRKALVLVLLRAIARERMEKIGQSCITAKLSNEPGDVIAALPPACRAPR